MASDQDQLNMSPPELSNPGNMEDSTCFSTPQMTNTSMPNQYDQSQNYQLDDLALPSGEKTHFLQTNQSQCQQGYQGGIEEMSSLQCSGRANIHFQHTNHPQPIQSYQIQDGFNEMKSLQFSSAAGTHIQLENQTQLTQSYQIPGGIDASDGVVNFPQTSQQAYQSQINQYSLPSTSGSARHSQQFQLNQVVQIQTDQLNNLPYTSGRVVHSQQSNQPQLIDAYHSQTDQSISLPSTSGGARHSQQPHVTQTSQSPTDQLIFLQPASDGMMHSQRTSHPQLSESCQSQNQLNSLQPMGGTVGNSQQSKLNRACQRQTNQLNFSQYATGTVLQIQETRPPQLIQEESSHGSQQTKSRSGNTLSDDNKEPTKSSIYSKRSREKNKKRMQDTLDENELLKKEVQRLTQNHHGSSSTSLASLPGDHHERNSVKVEQMKLSYEVVRKLEEEKKILTAKRNQLEQFHYSKAFARPTEEANGFQAQFINGSQMNNDVQDPQRTAISSSGGTENQENSQVGATSIGESLEKINANGMAGQGSSKGFNVFDFIQPAPQHAETKDEQQQRLTKPSRGYGSKFSKMKVHTVNVSPPSLKRTHETEVVPFSYFPQTEIAIPQTIQLTMEQTPTESTFDNPLVARKVARVVLPQVDKDKMNSSCSVNASSSFHYAWLAMAHASKTEEQVEKLYRDCSLYYEKIHSLTQSLDELKAEKVQSDLQVTGLKIELEQFKEEMNRAEAIREENTKKVVQEALTNFQQTPEFEAAAKRANVEGVRGAFALAVAEVMHVYPELDVSMISIDDLKTVRDNAAT